MRMKCDKLHSLFLTQTGSRMGSLVPSTVVLEMWNHKKRGLVQGPYITREATLPACLLDVGDVMFSPARAPSTRLHYKVTQ